MNHFTKIAELHDALRLKPPENPLFSIPLGNQEDCGGGELEFTADFYIIGFRKLQSGSVHYGKTKYDHDRGFMSFTKPNQLIAFKNVQLRENGFLLLLHQDFLLGSPLFQEIKKYGYFDYEVNEALHLSPAEEKIIWNLIFTLEKESNNNTDDFSKSIMVSHLDTLFKYAQRFYKRQFINRTDLSGVLTTKFNALLENYNKENKISEIGLPSVAFMAEKLNVSSRYLSDLLKQETGKTAIELIHLHLISEAKNMLNDGSLNISEISFALGFENPTYFSRLFKKQVGMTPNEFRNN